MEICKIKNILQLNKIKNGEEVEFDFYVVKKTYWNDPNFGVFQGYIIDTEDKIARSHFAFSTLLGVSGLFPFCIPINMSYTVRGTVEEYKGVKNVKVCSICPRVPTDAEIVKIIEQGSILVDMNYIVKTFIHEYEAKCIDYTTFVAYWKHIKAINNSEHVKANESIKKKINHDEMSNVLSFIADVFVKDMTFKQCMDWGFSQQHANVLYRTYGSETVVKISENPYSIIADSEETDFKFPLCDKIASHFDTLSYTSEERLKAAVDFAISQFEINGHCYQSIEDIVPMLKRVLTVKLKRSYLLERFKGKVIQDLNSLNFFNTSLSITKQDYYNIVTNGYEQTVYVPDEKLCFDMINKAILEGYVILEEDRVYRKSIYNFETEVASKLLSMVDFGNNNRDLNINVDKILPQHQLEEKQKEAITQAISSKGGVLIINGPAGSGKSYCCKALIEAYSKLHNISEYEKRWNFKLMAPTGRASKIMTERSGLPATTIHRGLKYNPIEDCWMINASNQIIESVVMVDEASMLNIELTYRLISACKKDTKLILFGDVNQLQPVGAGNVLLDLINSKKIPIVTLDVIKRQIEGSDIIQAATCTLKKEVIPFGGLNKDMFYINKNTEDAVVKNVIACINKIFKTKNGTIENTIVISPQKEGITGVNYLNYLIQEQLNPYGKQTSIVAGSYENPMNNKRESLYFREGDSVINIKNNSRAEWYLLNGETFIKIENSDSESQDNQGVYNGEIGIIERVEVNKKLTTLYVRYEDHYIKYSKDFGMLNLGYAITTHKGQGSQWKNVVGVVGNVNARLNCNNNIYTIITRASQFLALCTVNNQLMEGVRNTYVQSRNTTLKNRLRNEINIEVSE